MSYELINKELGIYSCGIADLTYEQVSNFYKLWNKESNIGSLTVFYDHDNDRIVLNREHKCFEAFSIIACTYIEQPETRSEIKNMLNSTALKNFINILDKALENRRIKEIKELLGKQIFPNNWNLIMDQLDRIYDYKNPSVSRLSIYTYGYINGKRAERQRKSNQRKVVS